MQHERAQCGDVVVGMSGGGSKNGRVLKPYRYSNFWPQPADEIALHRAVLALPVCRWRLSLIRFRGLDTNVRASL